MSLTTELEHDPGQIVSLIEHTNVDPDAPESAIRTLAAEVLEYDFHSAVVVPYHVPLVADLLGDEAAVTTVIGFPYGVQNTAAKVSEVQALPEADEIDMVINRTAFAAGDHETVIDDIEAVVEAAGDRPVKCIIESPALTDSEIRTAAELVETAGADYVKTAVGYDGPADPDEVAAINEAVSDAMGIKASGGIGTFDEAMEMVNAGASRIGASSGVAIAESIPKEGQ